MQFALVDGSGGAATSTGQAMDPATLAKIAAACVVYLNRDVASQYGGAYRVRSSDGSDLQPGEIVFALLAELPNAPDAIAYHDVDGNGLPVLFDAISLSATLTGSGNSVAVAISHELAETAGDEGCDLWADSGSGEFAHELCDAVESDSYMIDQTGVWVSDFVTRAFWVPKHAGPYSFMASMGKSHGPGAPMATAAGGYQLVRSSGTGETQVTAMLPGPRFAARAKKRAHWGSRAWRRGVRV